MEHAVRRDETNSRVDPIRTRELGDRQDEFESMKQQNPQRVFYNKAPAAESARITAAKALKMRVVEERFLPSVEMTTCTNPNNFAHVIRTFEHLKGR